MADPLIATDFLKIVLAGILVLITVLIGQELYRILQKLYNALKS